MQIPAFAKHALCPKRRLRNHLPAVSDRALAQLIGRLAPPERRALAQIVETADLLIVDGKPWLLIQATDRLIDRLASFAAELEDREPFLEDEPEVIEQFQDGNESSTVPASSAVAPWDHQAAIAADRARGDEARRKFRARGGRPRRRRIGAGFISNDFGEHVEVPSGLSVAEIRQRFVVP